MDSLQGFEPLLIVMLWLLISVYSRVALQRRWRTSASPAPAPASRSLRLRWEQAGERYGRLAGEYAGYESDPLEVLRLPALADPAVPATTRFIEAFSEAMALRTEEYPPEPMAREFVDATARAEQAWTAAREAAEKLRASRFTAEERGLLAQAVKLLELAHRGATPAEQEAAYAAARQVLARLERSAGTRLDWRVSARARQVVDREGKPPLPPS